MRINKSYWPTRDENQRAWLIHFKAQLAILGASVGVTPAEITSFNTFCDAATASIDNVVTKKNAYESAVASRIQLVGAAQNFFRPLVRRIKTNPGFTPTIGAALAIDNESIPVDPSTVKPDLSATVHSGYVRLRIRRNGAASVNLYLRRSGEPGWSLVCRVEMATCQDTTALAHPGVPEVREYQAIGVIDDTEIGLPSNPAVVVYAGQIAA